MKNENDILMMGNIINDSSYTDNGDKSSERKIFLPKTLPNTVDDTQNKTLDEIIDNSDKLEGERIDETVILSNITDIYTTLEILFGQKLSGQCDTLT